MRNGAVRSRPTALGMVVVACSANNADTSRTPSHRYPPWLHEWDGTGRQLRSDPRAPDRWTVFRSTLPAQSLVAGVAFEARISPVEFCRW